MMKLPASFRLFSALSVLALSSVAAQGATAITGTVVNQSREKPAFGEEVILVRLVQWPREEARAKTDAKGAFTLPVQHADEPYVVRVFHQGVSYDQRASVGDVLTIQVFDAALRVRNVTGSIEILRAEANGHLLHVSDMYEVRNESNPPLTQIGKRTFEIYLPANAKMDSVLAAGPGKMGLMISASPVSDEPGHWSVNFPLRPGATKFAFNYELPYDGHATFRTKHVYPLEQLAIMIPPTMRFLSRSPAFETLRADSSHYQVRAANHLEAGEGPEFEVSGSGDLPPLGRQAEDQARSPAALRRTAKPSSVRIDRGAKPPSQSPALGVVIGVLLAVCVGLVWRVRKGLYSVPSEVETKP
jgi:hypothetical protein